MYNALGSIRIAFLFIAVIILGPLAALAGTSGISYHGRILRPDGTPLEGSAVQFRLQIRTPDASNCLLFEETKLANLKGSAGVFELTLNDGNGSRTDTTGLTLDLIFANRGTLTGTNCVIGPASYSPGASDGRRFQVLFRDENMSAWEPLPAQSLNYIPLAIEAKQVGGFSATSLMRVEDTSGPQLVSALSPAQYSELFALSSGSSTNYLKANSSGALAPTRSANPTSPAAGQIWFDTATAQLKFYDGTAIQSVSAGGAALPALSNGAIWIGNISNAATALTLSGDVTISNSAVSTLKNTGTAGSYFKVTTDAQGRVTSGATSLIETDIPALTTAGKVSGSAINSGTIAGTAAINTSGNITTTGTVTSTNSSTLTASSQTVRVFNASNTFKTTISVPAGLATDFNFTLPSTAGASGYSLITDGSGNLSWAPTAAGTVTTVSGTAPIIVGGTATAPIIAISAATTAASGAVTLAPSGGTTASTVIQATDARLSDARAPAGAAGGDLSSTFPAPTVAKIRGVAIGTAAPVTSQVLRYSASSWDPAYVNLADLRTSLGTSQIPTTCSSAQTWSYSAITDMFSCMNIALPVSQVSGLGTAAAKNIPSSGNASTTEIVYGTDTRLTDTRIPSGIAGGDLAGTYPLPTLTTTGVTAGTYPKVTIDSKGRVTTGTPLSATDIPSLDWAKITTGKPTTLTGYGITDSVVNNAGGVISLQSGLDAAKPAASTDGRLYVATDSAKIYRDNGTTWILVSSASGTGVSSITAGPGLTGGNITTTGTIGLGTSGATAGTYKSLTVDTYGRVTSATNPTTLTGFGITDAVANGGSVPSISSGNDASKGTATTLGRVYITNDTKKIYRDNGTSWDLVTSLTAADLTGPVNAAQLPASVLLDGGNTPAASLSVGTTNSQALQLKTGGSARMTVDTSGNIGIGTTTPASQVTIAMSGASDSTNYGKGLQIINLATGGQQAAFIRQGLRVNSLGYLPGSSYFGFGPGSTLDSSFNPNIIGFDTSGNVGIGTTTPGAPLEVRGAIRLSGVTSGYTGFQPAAVAGSTVWTLPAVDGGANSVLTTNGSGILSWSTPTGTGVSNIAVNAPIANSGTATAPNLSIAAASTSANGYLTSNDWNSFNNKQSTTLTNGQIHVGNASNVAAGVSLSGDATITNSGVMTVGKIQNRNIASTMPVTSQVLRYNTSNTTWETQYLNISDLKKSDGTTQFQSASCAAGQTLTWSLITDLFTCTTISITKSQVSDLGTIGTAASQNFGSAAGNLVQLDGSAKIPSALLPAGTATQWVTSGSNIAYSSGNVGIGTTAPLGTLHVAGTVVNSNYGDAFTGNAYQSSGWKYVGTGPAWNLGGYSGDNTAFRILTASSGTVGNPISWRTSLAIDAMAGNVGIGTSTPAAALDLKATSTSQAAMLIRGDSSAYWPQVSLWFQDAASGGHNYSIGNGGSTGAFSIADQTAGQARLSITSAGNIGIGTMAPTSTLTVQTDGTGTGGNLQQQIKVTGSATNPMHLKLGVNDAGTYSYIQSTQLNVAHSNLNLNPSGGNVGIGTASPGYKLDVQGGDINATGSVRAAGVALTSDARFKRDIESIDHALEKILNIRGVSYNWRRDEFPLRQFNNRHQIGVIAQEVEAQFPEVVDTNADGFKSVNYPALIAPLIEAVKTLYGRVIRIENHQSKQELRIAQLIANDQANTKNLLAKDREIADLKARLEKIEKLLQAK